MGTFGVDGHFEVLRVPEPRHGAVGVHEEVAREVPVNVNELRHDNVRVVGAVEEVVHLKHVGVGVDDEDAEGTHRVRHLGDARALVSPYKNLRRSAPPVASSRAKSVDAWHCLSSRVCGRTGLKYKGKVV